MVITCDVTATTATADTVETTIGTITLPSNAKKVIGVGVQLDAAGLTTLDGTGGTFRVTCNNKDVTPSKWPIESIVALTSGACSLGLRIFPVDWEDVGNGVLTFYVTMDQALTVHPTAKGFAIYHRL